MSAALTFWVEGKPVPWGRARAFVHPGTGRLIHTTDPKTRAWESKVSLLARSAANRSWLPEKGPVAVAIDVHGYSKRADLDNAAKAILDGMNGIVFADDRQVVDLHVRRVDDGAEGARITVTRLGAPT